MQRGDIVMVDLEPTVGSEASKIRPAIVVSNNGANRAAEKRQRGVIVVIPLTSNITHIASFQVLIDDIEGLRTASKAQPEQIRAVDIQRVRQTIGHLPPLTMSTVDKALRVQLGL